MWYCISTNFPNTSGYTIVVHSIDSGNVVKSGTGDEYEFAIIGNAHPEGGNQPDGLSPLVHEYNNKCMILKESFEVTGSEATNIVYVKVDNEKMGSGYVWYLKGESDTYKRFLDYYDVR